MTTNFQHKASNKSKQLTKISEPYVAWVYIGITVGMGVVFICLILYILGIIDILPSAKTIADSWGLSLKEFIKTIDISIQSNIFLRLGFVILLMIPFTGYGILFMSFLKNDYCTKYKALIAVILLQIAVFGMAIAVSI